MPIYLKSNDPENLTLWKFQLDYRPSYVKHICTLVKFCYRRIYLYDTDQRQKKWLDLSKIQGNVFKTCKSIEPVKTIMKHISIITFNVVRTESESQCICTAVEDTIGKHFSVYGKSSFQFTGTEYSRLMAFLNLSIKVLKCKK